MSGPVCLVVLDGFGLGEGGAGDAIAHARTPFFDRLDARYPKARVETSGAAVGLPEGQMGNSEVGHMTLGAGRILDCDLVRIRKALEARDPDPQAVLERVFQVAERSGEREVHLLGLVSEGGVHSSVRHLELLLDRVAERGLRPVLHAITDGRDTPPRSALQWLGPLEARLRAAGGVVSTVCGRYYAMDRDQRWERVERAYRALVHGEGVGAASAVEAVEKAYAGGQGDEFVEPSAIAGGPRLRAGSAALFFNFRADRARELSNALVHAVPEALGESLAAQGPPQLGILATLTVYDASYGLPSLFEPIDLRGGLAERVSASGGRQLRIAETEKYAHVTYFFNGGVEAPVAGEQRILIPSPREVATYDEKPEMSALAVTDALLEALDREAYAFVLVNYANPDMVGHTGVLPAGIEAVETVDRCLERLSSAVLERGGSLLITADHGNVEQMIDDSGGPHTAHTTNPVPLWWVAEPPPPGLHSGGLADIAPTLCALLGLAPSPEMTGRCLLVSGSSSSSS